MKRLFAFFAAAFLLTFAPLAAVHAGPETAQICPVTGDPVKSDKFTAQYQGKTYRFCCRGCVKKFTKNPSKYITA